MNKGIPPCSWGPAAWHFLHSISFGYPDMITNSKEDQELKYNTFRFFEGLADVLPCPECKKHYRQNFNSMNLMNSLDTRKDFTRWVYDLHNLVNSQTGKKGGPSYEEVYKKFNSLMATDCGDKKAIRGTCSAGGEEMQCKVELVPKSSMSSMNNEYFANMEEDWWKILLIALACFIVGIAVGYFMTGTKKKVRRYY